MALLSPTTCELKPFQRKEIASKFPFLSLSVCLVTQSCLSLCNPMNCSPPGSSVHGILQARILEWAAISFSRGSFQPRDQTCISCIGRWILCHWATREACLYIYAFHFISFISCVFLNSLFQRWREVLFLKFLPLPILLPHYPPKGNT